MARLLDIYDRRKAHFWIQQVVIRRRIKRRNTKQYNLDTNPTSIVYHFPNFFHENFFSRILGILAFLSKNDSWNYLATYESTIIFFMNSH